MHLKINLSKKFLLGMIITNVIYLGVWAKSHLISYIMTLSEFMLQQTQIKT